MKKLLALTMVLVLVFAGCQVAKESEPETNVDDVAPPQEVEQLPEEDETENTEDTADSEDVAVPESKEDYMKELIASTTENEYPELEVTAAILERNLILPGASYRIHVYLKNNGDKTLSYVHGSGTAVNPDSIFLSVPEMQVVPAKENLGAMTMDYRVDQIAPGETKEYVYSVMAINPVENFEEIARNYLVETEKYIGEENLEVLAEKYPELTAVEAGQYTGEVYFFYSVVGEDGNMDVTGTPSGHAKTELNIAIS